MDSIKEISIRKVIVRIRIFLLLVLIAVILSAGCASSRKNPYYEKRIRASQANTKQLGRNRYYFSKSYQKKLAKSYKRKVRY